MYVIFKKLLVVFEVVCRLNYGEEITLYVSKSLDRNCFLCKYLCVVYFSIFKVFFIV